VIEKRNVGYVKVTECMSSAITYPAEASLPASFWAGKRVQVRHNCVNCGAPAFPTDSQCSYCLTVHK
jgi:uncharacterized OB-fold protein